MFESGKAYIKLSTKSFVIHSVNELIQQLNHQPTKLTKTASTGELSQQPSSALQIGIEQSNCPTS